MGEKTTAGLPSRTLSGERVRDGHLTGLPRGLTPRAPETGKTA